MKFLTPEQITQRATEGKRLLNERQVFLNEVMKKLGYRDVPSVKELNLTDEERKKLMHVRDNFFNTRFIVADRLDGSLVRALVRTREEINSDEFSAELFSPAFFNGHASNHDFNRGEFEGILKKAVQGPVYPSNK
ncbi:MAG: hypothetical protein V4699_02290 [Patescibacteria group bacterium]